MGLYQRVKAVNRNRFLSQIKKKSFDPLVDCLKQAFRYSDIPSKIKRVYRPPAIIEIKEEISCICNYLCYKKVSKKEVQQKLNFDTENCMDSLN